MALIDESRLVLLAGRLDTAGVVALAGEHRPAVVGIDSPRACAPPGHTTRECERRLAAAVCGIRWTPDEENVRGNPFYAWIVHGLELFAALAGDGAELLEVFPTASWTRWIGERGSCSRANWTRLGLAALGLAELPGRTNQDQRDAIAAAVTARQFWYGLTDTIGEIVVPRAGA